MSETPVSCTAPPRKPAIIEALKFWFKLGFISFGGPTGKIAIMHTELVEKRRWISEARFLQALNYCMLLPGPEAQQLATYIGSNLCGFVSSGEPDGGVSHKGTKAQRNDRELERELGMRRLIAQIGSKFVPGASM